MPKPANNRSRRALCLDWSEELFLAITTKGHELEPGIEGLNLGEVKYIDDKVFGERLPPEVISYVFHTFASMVLPINGNSIFLMAAVLDGALESFDMARVKST